MRDISRQDILASYIRQIESERPLGVMKISTLYENLLEIDWESLPRDSAALADAQAYINSIDFSMLIQKLCTRDRLNWRPWSEVEIREGLLQYRNYLFLLRKYGGNGVQLPPSTDIDELWHHHILNTRQYFRDCTSIFGGYLHHFPYFGMRGASDYQDLLRAFEKTQELYALEFGDYLYIVRDGLDDA